jgi:hypothetical protein
MRHHISFAVVGLAVISVLGAAPAAAQRTLDIRRFDSEMMIRRDGSMSVTERIQVHFSGSWNGLLRAIPVEYATDAGANYTLRIDVGGAQDADGNELRVESERSGRDRIFRIWVPGAVDATRDVVFRYRVRNGVRFFDEHDELYWNVTGAESEFPIQQASAKVYLPAEATGIRTTSYTGGYGATGSDATVTHAGNLLEFQTTRPLGFREGLTIVVGWDPGLVHRPSSFDRASGFLYSNFILGVPLLAFVGMLTLWRRSGRDPRLRPIAPQYEPPPGLTPGEVGTLVDASPDMRDVTATIVDLAVRGFLTIEETREEHLFGLLSSQDYAFHLAKPRHEWNALKAHEVELLDALFKNERTSVRSSQLENSFYRDLPGITKHLRASLTSGRHYLRHPDSVRATFVALGVVAGVAVAMGGTAFLTKVLGQEPLSAIAAGLLTAGVVIGFGFVMPARTAEGTRTLETLLGFEEFLSRVESERFERVIKTPEMFEKFLPYAMAFGVENNWSRAFEDIYSTPPNWYRGSTPHGFRCHAFAGNLSRMASTTATAMQKAPRSSSGSSGFGGRSGGGFSGGGFGGGRTGGF